MWLDGCVICGDTRVDDNNDPCWGCIFTECECGAIYSVVGECPKCTKKLKQGVDNFKK